MPHNFSKKRTSAMPSYVPDMGFRKLYACNSCHNLQTQVPTCMLCYRDDTLLALSQLIDKDTVGFFPGYPNYR
jgi:hypothetical protein